MFETAQWIWQSGEARPDEFCEFTDTFVSDGAPVLHISCDSNYTVYVNGTLCAFGQYPDFETHKVYDTIELKDAAVCGENRLCIVVWYYGADTQTYTKGRAGLIFAVTEGGKTIAESDSSVLSRLSRTYVSHRCRLITPQLGFSYFYDAAGRDGWLAGDPAALAGFSPAVTVDKPRKFFPRPIRKTVMRAAVPSVVDRLSDTRYRVDLGRETVGFLLLDLYSETAQTVTVAYGEHLADGCVRRRIGDRDFSVLFGAAAGENRWHDTFLRLGCRYLEIESERPITLRCATLLPVEYPFTEIPYTVGSPLRDRIYRVCVDTLKLCAHEHYEDCPWREQALYAMDSRNQMLCGYYAFGEYRFARASLELLALNIRPDGLLSICSPAGVDLTIPSFSLHYFTEVREYTDYSGDTTLAEQVLPVLKRILAAYSARIKDDLVYNFSGTAYWNFYEWADGLAGNLWQAEPENVTDLVLNCLYISALEHMAAICRKLGQDDAPYTEAADRGRAAVNRTFRDPDGTYRMYADTRMYSELGNSLAVLCGAADARSRAVIAKCLTSDSGWTKITLSMKCFLYDALLVCGDYAGYVLRDIDVVYGRMLDAGATSVWETEKGEADFGGAGSLCHGWSALPVYYFHTLLSSKNQ